MHSTPILLDLDVLNNHFNSNGKFFGPSPGEREKGEIGYEKKGKTYCKPFTLLFGEKQVKPGKK